jgi:bis(5'-nucleosyl)-tetraphosphatase (symmetrical)
MATYVIGDLQGCFRSLQGLLDSFGFNRGSDKLWFVGDLVNRGPDSLAVLRFVKDLGDSAVTVLGNHDLHLLAVAEGFERLKRDDTLDEILAAPDRRQLLDWLRRLPLTHFEHDVLMVHAGLLPDWDAHTACALGREVEHVLRGPQARSFFAHMYGNQPDRWRAGLRGMDRLRVIVNAMTRLRLCSIDGVMELAHKGSLTEAPAGYMPWFEIAGRRSRGTRIVFGHWSALGLVRRPNVLGLDTGCLWGRRLSAFRLEDRRLFQVRCRETRSQA